MVDHQPAGGVQRHPGPDDGRNDGRAAGRRQRLRHQGRGDRGFRAERVLLRQRPGRGQDQSGVLRHQRNELHGPRKAPAKAGHRDGGRLRDRVGQHPGLHLRLHRPRQSAAYSVRPGRASEVRRRAQGSPIWPTWSDRSGRERYGCSPSSTLPNRR